MVLLGQASSATARIDKSARQPKNVGNDTRLVFILFGRKAGKEDCERMRKVRKSLRKEGDIEAPAMEALYLESSDLLR